MEKITDADYVQIVNILDNKIPQNQINKIITKIQKASDLQDFWDSPYTRPTFTKVLLLFILILSSLIWLVYPVYNILLSDDSIKRSREAILENRGWLTNKDFSFELEITKTTNWHDEVRLYDWRSKELLAVSDLINNKSFLVSTKMNGFNISTTEERILKTSNVDLSEDIRKDVIKIINNNLNVKDTYMDFKSIDFWLDTLINVTQ